MSTIPSTNVSLTIQDLIALQECIDAFSPTPEEAMCYCQAEPWRLAILHARLSAAKQDALAQAHRSA